MSLVEKWEQVEKLPWESMIGEDKALHVSHKEEDASSVLLNAG